MLSITKVFRFEACHHLPHYVGPCHNLHGHSYKLEVSVVGRVRPEGDKQGMIHDFGDLKRLVNDLVISKYDHADLNQFFDNPTAEIMVQKIAEDLSMALPNNLAVYRIKLWETDTSYAMYEADL